MCQNSGFNRQELFYKSLYYTCTFKMGIWTKKSGYQGCDNQTYHGKKSLNRQSSISINSLTARAPTTTRLRAKYMNSLLFHRIVSRAQRKVVEFGVLKMKLMMLRMCVLRVNNHNYLQLSHTMKYWYNMKWFLINVLLVWSSSTWQVRTRACTCRFL